MPRPLPLILTFFCTASAFGSFSYSISLGAFYSSPGVDLSTQNPASGIGGAIGILVASKDGSLNFPQGAAISGQSLTQYAPFGNSNFVIVSVHTAVSATVVGDPLGPAAIFAGITGGISYPLLGPGANPGDPVAFYWFSHITDTNSATTPNTNVNASRVTIGGEKYGFYRYDSAPNNSGVISSVAPMVLPADGSTAVRIASRNVDFLTDAQEALGGPIPPVSQFITPEVSLEPPPIPEPSSFAAWGAVLALLAAVSRRKRLHFAVA